MPRQCVFMLVLALTACAQQPTAPSPDQVILLPGSDGTVGAVIVQQGGQSATLDREYAAARASAAGTLEVSQADPAAIRAQFADALGALPPVPVSFIVYFVFGQDELTEESRKELGPVLQDMARRQAPEITVIGHADQAGPERINDTLAMRRAERVKEMLVQRGVRADRINAVGRGSREPAVRAAEGVPEARNRRVEISVR
ncbi:MAG TPA: OmpA family protein [Burkholderiales bacterium]|nr:OmpA family protein [Burkholderiales bacterium]